MTSFLCIFGLPKIVDKHTVPVKNEVYCLKTTIVDNAQAVCDMYRPQSNKRDLEVSVCLSIYLIYRCLFFLNNIHVYFKIILKFIALWKFTNNDKLSPFCQMYFRLTEGQNYHDNIIEVI